MSETERRKESERVFHNLRFGSEQDVRGPLHKWYAALAKGSRSHIGQVLDAARDATVLEYGCADGSFSLMEQSIPKRCRHYYGIDISDLAILQATENASALSLRNCEFIAMDAENMSFPDGTFDLVFGRGILHHLDLERCYSEISRVLRSGGTALFLEPMGHNPLINGFRARTPNLRTPDEHPLLMNDLVLGHKYFSQVSMQFFGLATLLAVPFRSTVLSKPFMSVCEFVDDFLLAIPGVQRAAWHVLIGLRK